MKNNQLDKALKIVKKTGDKFLIMDKETDDVFALMSLESYEDLVMDFDDFDPDFDPSDNFFEVPDESDSNSDEEDWSEDVDFNSEELNGPVYHKIDENESLQNKNKFAIPEERLGGGEDKEENVKKDENDFAPIKNSGEWRSIGNIISEEALDDLPEDDPEEDKFYLEPVE